MTVHQARPEETLHRGVVRVLLLARAPGVSWYHPANGGSRNAAEAGKLKALGVRPGVPDIALVKDGHAHFLELKAQGAGRARRKSQCMQN